MKFFKDNTKFFIVFVISVSLSLIFIEPISKLLLKIGGNLDYDTTSFKIGFFAISLLLFLIYGHLIYKSFIHNKRITFFVFFIATFYFFLRFVFTDYIHFKSLGKLFVYADLILFFALIHSLNLVRVWIKKIRRQEKEEDRKFNIKLIEKNENFFIEDKVFNNGEIDNEAILQKLIDVIVNFKPDIAFSIGINAVWGYGKSSFLERFEKEFIKKNEKTVIIFWYHIWKNKGSTAIIENFFDELKESLKPYSAEISEDINNYVKSILSLSNGDLHKLISNGIDVLSENNTLEKYHKTINESIKKIDKQIVILLDDLDRLEKDEILNSLKLIRTLSDFNNVIFIAGYDREYIVKTIEKPKDNYLDKVFNVEINLLPFEYKLIEDELLKQIGIAFPLENGDTDYLGFNSGFKNLFVPKKLKISDIKIKNIIGENKVSCTSNKLSFKDFLKTYRDVKRFVNEFKFNASLSKVEKNVIADEYILLKLLTYKYRELPNLIFNKIDEVLESGQYDIENNKIQVFGDSLSNDTYFYDEDVKKKVNSLLENIYPIEDIEIINAVICKLFVEKSKEYYQQNQNTISKIYYTDIYLRNNILGAEITISDLQNAFVENNILSIAEIVVASKTQSKYQLLNEIKQFIFNNAAVTKDQFVDSLESINIILSNASFSESQKVLDIINNGYINLYNKNKDDLLQDLLSIIKKPFIAYLDSQFGELMINIKRKESEQNYGAGMVIYENNPFSSDELKEMLLIKLRYLIEIKSDPQVIFQAYHLLTEKIVLEKTILRSKEANKLLKEDIKSRIEEYVYTDYFDFLRKPMKETDFEFVGWQPNYFFAQIFSKDKTYNEVIEKPNEKEIYKLFIAEGWDSFNQFIQSLDVVKLNLDEKHQKNMNKGKELIQAFIKNNYVQLSWSQYSNIWIKNKV